MSMIPTVSYAHRIPTAVFGITIRYETYVSELQFHCITSGTQRELGCRCHAAQSPDDVRKGLVAPPLWHGARVCQWLIADWYAHSASPTQPRPRLSRNELIYMHWQVHVIFAHAFVFRVFLRPSCSLLFAHAHCTIMAQETDPSNIFKIILPQAHPTLGKPCFFFLYFFVLFLTFLQESRKRNPIYFLNYLPARKKSRLSFKK